MRVLLTAQFHQSGQTTHVVELARALADMGHTVMVVSLGRSHPEALAAYCGRLNDDGIPCKHAVKSGHFFSSVLSFAPDVVHGHSSTAIPHLLRVKESRGIPVVVTCHGLGIPARYPSVAKADRCIAVGPNVARELEAHGIASTIIGNGVDTERFRPGVKADCLTIAYVGRIDTTKRMALRELIGAAGRIPGARLEVASNERPTEPGCTALGWVDDVSKLLAESHFVCGTGRAIREGMACGCIGIVLGAKYAGPVTPDRFDSAAFPSFSGSEGDRPRADAMRADLVRLSQDPATRERLAAWSRDFACRRFPVSKMAEAVTAAYEDAIGSCRP